MQSIYITRTSQRATRHPPPCPPCRPASRQAYGNQVRQLSNVCWLIAGIPLAQLVLVVLSAQLNGVYDGTLSLSLSLALFLSLSGYPKTRYIRSVGPIFERVGTMLLFWICRVFGYYFVIMAERRFPFATWPQMSWRVEILVFFCMSFFFFLVFYWSTISSACQTLVWHNFHMTFTWNNGSAAPTKWPNYRLPITLFNIHIYIYIPTQMCVYGIPSSYLTNCDQYAVKSN